MTSHALLELIWDKTGVEVFVSCSCLRKTSGTIDIDRILITAVKILFVEEEEGSEKI